MNIKFLAVCSAIGLLCGQDAFADSTSESSNVQSKKEYFESRTDEAKYRARSAKDFEGQYPDLRKSTINEEKVKSARDFWKDKDRAEVKGSNSDAPTEFQKNQEFWKEIEKESTELKNSKSRGDPKNLRKRDPNSKVQKAKKFLEDEAGKTEFKNTKSMKELENLEKEGLVRANRGNFDNTGEEEVFFDARDK